MLGRYHPHGDASVYDAMVRMAQEFSLRYPLVDGHGNFGSIDGDPPAAYRYTESRMSKLAMSMLTDIDKDTIDFGKNYDDRLDEPKVLPSKLPNLLINGSTGIAVGMATNIPPHNLNEIVDALCVLIDDPDVGLETLMQHIKGPDFPTGGIIMGKAGIRAAYATGRGKLVVRGRAFIEEDKSGKLLIAVTEIPYMVNKAALIENIADQVKDKRIEGISYIRDESDRDGMRIVFELKRDANPQIVLNKLYSYSQLQDTFGVIMLALCGGVPKVLTLREMLTEYLSFQCEVIRRRTQFELNKAGERAHILDGLIIALDFIDEVISILRSSKSIPEGKQALTERFGLDDVQTSAIVAMRLGQLTGLEREKLEEELAALKAKIEELTAILGDEGLVRAIVRGELTELKQKFGDERRTEIQSVSGEVDIEDLIPNELSMLTLTHFGYIKRQPVESYKAQKRGGRGIAGMTTREEDFAEEMFVLNAHDYVMFFTSRGRAYRIKCYEIPEGSRTSKGTNIVNILPLEQGEKVTSMIRVTKENHGGYLVMVTMSGVIKRVRLAEFDNVRKSGIIAINLDDNDELAWVRLTGGCEHLLIGTYLGMSIRFDEDEVRPVGRTARGVKAITLSDGDRVVGMAAVKEGEMLLTVSEYGRGRRTAFDEYRLQSRGGKGSINYKPDDEKGNVAGIMSVGEDDDLVVIASDGVIIRLPVESISIQSRYAGGVRVMRVNEGERIVTLAHVHSDTDNEAGDIADGEITDGEITDGDITDGEGVTEE